MNNDRVVLSAILLAMNFLLCLREKFILGFWLQYVKWPLKKKTKRCHVTSLVSVYIHSLVWGTCTCG